METNKNINVTEAEIYSPPVLPEGPRGLNDGHIMLDLPIHASCISRSGQMSQIGSLLWHCIGSTS